MQGTQVITGKNNWNFCNATAIHCRTAARVCHYRNIRSVNGHREFQPPKEVTFSGSSKLLCTHLRGTKKEHIGKLRRTYLEEHGEISEQQVPLGKSGSCHTQKKFEQKKQAFVQPSFWKSWAKLAAAVTDSFPSAIRSATVQTVALSISSTVLSGEMTRQETECSSAWISKTFRIPRLLGTCGI